MREKLYNLHIDNINTEQALSKFSEFLDSDTNNLIFFVNAHCFNIAQKNDEYNNALKNAALVLNDGIGIKIACNIYGFTVKENMNGTDLIPKIIKLGVEKQANFFFLGSKPGIADKVRDNLEKKYPAIKVTGTHHGYFDPDKSDEVVENINKSNAKILIAGMGVPVQELFLSGNQVKLKTVRVSIAGGAFLDFQSGLIPRAPMWMRRLSIEWLYRFLIEPKRMFRRYFIGGIRFFAIIILTRFHLRRLKEQEQNQSHK